MRFRVLAELARLEEELGRTAAAAGRSLGSFGASDSLGVPADFREALAFAVLGARLAVGEPSSGQAVTGARPGRVLGKWSPAVVGSPLGPSAGP